MDFINFNFEKMFHEETEPILTPNFKDAEEQKEYYKTNNDSYKRMQIFSEKKYHEVLKSIEGKDYKELLPKEIINKKRSTIKKYILDGIDRVYNFLQNSPLYSDQNITKESIVIYMMLDFDNSNYILARHFIKKVSFMDLLIQNKLENPDATGDDLDKELVEETYKGDRELSYLRQIWESYLDWVSVRKGVPVNAYSFEEDGFPSASRGNICYLFLPVKNLSDRTLTDQVELYNPRNKKNQMFTDLVMKDDCGDILYSAINPKGKKVFLADHSVVEDSWDALFSLNKEIYGGWWNKVMILNNK